MKLNFRLSFENYYEYNRVYSRISIGKNISAICKTGIFMAVVGIVILACFFAGVLTKTASLLLGSIIFAIGVFMVIYANLIFSYRLKKEVRRKYRTSDYFKVERTVELLDTHFLAYSENDEYRGDYSEDIKEFIETENLFLIMVRGRRGIIIPKKSVDEKEVARTIRRIAEDYDIGRRRIKG